jgi:hypothetical protein
MSMFYFTGTMRAAAAADEIIYKPGAVDPKVIYV